jgi:hypothetical protein
MALAARSMTLLCLVLSLLLAPGGVRAMNEPNGSNGTNATNDTAPASSISCTASNSEQVPSGE